MHLSSNTGADIVLAGLTIPTDGYVRLSPNAYLADETRRQHINALYVSGDIAVAEENEHADGSTAVVGAHYSWHWLPGEVFPTLTAGEVEAGASHAAAETFDVVLKVAGILTVAAGVELLPIPFDAKLVKVQAKLGTYVAGAALLVDVNKNGTTVFTTQANRITIADGQSAVEAHAADWHSADAPARVFSEGDTLSMDVDQIGTTSGHHGSDLDVVFTFEKTTIEQPTGD